MDTQHGRERIGRATTLGAGLGIVGLNQINQFFPRHHIFYLDQKVLPPGALFGSRLPVITVGEALRAALTELLAAHKPSPYLRLQGYYRADSSGFPEPPWPLRIE